MPGEIKRRPARSGRFAQYLPDDPPAFGFSPCRRAGAFWQKPGAGVIVSVASKHGLRPHAGDYHITDFLALSVRIG